MRFIHWGFAVAAGGEGGKLCGHGSPRKKKALHKRREGRLNFFLPFHPPLSLVCVRTHTLRYFSFQFRISATSASFFSRENLGRCLFYATIYLPFSPFFLEGKMCVPFSVTFSRQLAKRRGDLIFSIPEWFYFLTWKYKGWKT